LSKHFARISCIAAGLLLAAAGTQARMIEEQLDIPVKVQDAYGKTIAQTIKVTVFADPANPQPAPVLLLNHGRAAEPADRAALGRARYPDAAAFLVKRGFIVAVPTRIGYGVSGGEDIENTGPCNRRDYLPGYAAAAQQSLTVLEAMRQRHDAAKDRAVVMGQSFGGATAIAVASMDPPGVQAAINFAGGGGGNPKTQPQRPCASHLLERMFGGYGKTAKMPTLWLYAENDMYFGPKLPREWHQAFTQAGGKAQFVQYPAQPEDGHLLFNRHPELWQPRVAEFLDRAGFPIPTAKGPRP
jgi:dienelactone hydrolase